MVLVTFECCDVQAETRRNVRQQRFWEMVREAGLEWREMSVAPQTDRWNLSFGVEEPIRIYSISRPTPT